MRENNVTIYGMVAAEPIIYKTRDEDGKELYRAGRVTVMTARKSRMNQFREMEGNIYWDKLLLYSANPYIVEKILQPLELGDLVFALGSLSTKDTFRKYICPKCNEQFKKDQAVIVYVDVEHIKIMERGLKIEEGTKLVEESADISNHILIAGNLCREVEYYDSGAEGGKEAQFQIASNRIRKIEEDGAEKRTDYPYIKAYGTRAEEYRDALHVGSEIFVNGAIQTREYDKGIECPECGHAFVRSHMATEIVPYHIEYVADCILPEPTHADPDEFGDSEMPEE